jgi:hypothetical protein
MTLSNQSHFPGFLSPRKVNFKIPINSGLGQARIACPRKMAADPLFGFNKMTFLRPQITEDDLPGPGQFWLVISWNWPGPSKSSSVI